MSKYDDMTPEELKNELERRDTLRTLSEDASGVIVTTPNPAYTGATHGIQFHNGMAFVPRPPDDDENAINDWSLVIQDLEHVFGYEVRDGTMAEFQKLTR